MTIFNNVVPMDFHPFNGWKVEEDGATYNNGAAKYIVDQRTGKRYFNERAGTVRGKGVLVALGTPIVHVIAAIVNIAWRVFRLISFYNFWVPQDGEYNLKERAKQAAADLIRIVAAPLAIVAMELAAIYGVIRPYDGRKVFATFERAMYGHFVIAPCFQPGPKSHAFGGDPNRQGAF